MRRRLLDHDPLTGTTRYFHADATGDEFVIESVHDDTDTVETNKALYAMTDERARWGEMAHVGSIPMWLYYKLQAENVIDPEGNVHDEKPLLKWLQDRDNLDFRTRPGRLI